uniref:Uncharacterized protein n=1 Tax=Arundo donax TaxID=35708 RepID=A0A0A9HAV8_ARUDO
MDLRTGAAPKPLQPSK